MIRQTFVADALRQFSDAVAEAVCLHALGAAKEYISDAIQHAREVVDLIDEYLVTHNLTESVMHMPPLYVLRAKIEATRSLLLPPPDVSSLH